MFSFLVINLINTGMKITELSAPKITLHQELNPVLWDESERLRPEIEGHLVRISDQFVTDCGVTDIVDRVLVGSHAGYGYADDSSIVLAIGAKIPTDDVYLELLEERITAWNSDNSPRCGNYPVAVSVVDSNSPTDNGSYSLTERCWRNRPRGAEFSPQDVSVKILENRWSNRMNNSPVLEWIGEWRRLEKCGRGSAESVVVENLRPLANKLNRKTLAESEAEPKSHFRYGYGDSSKFNDFSVVNENLRSFVCQLIPPIPKIVFEKSNVPGRVSPCNLNAERNKIWQWTNGVESTLAEHKVSFTTIYGINSEEYHRRFMGRQLREWHKRISQKKIYLQESIAKKKEIIERLLNLTEVNTKLPAMNQEINLYEFIIEEPIASFEINIYNNQEVTRVDEQRGYFELADGETRKAGIDVLGTTTHVCGWLPAGTPNQTTSIILSSDFNGDGNQLDGWDYSIVDDANLSESRLAKWRRIMEDAEPTPDGVNPETQMFLNEKEVTPKADVVREFARLCIRYLEIENPPQIRLHRDPAWSSRNKTFGSYNPSKNTMELSLANRNIMDICRTLAHELVHCRQNERGELGPGSGRDGSPQENQANSVAGEIMRRWGKRHPEFFDSENIGESRLVFRKRAITERSELQTYLIDRVEKMADMIPAGSSSNFFVNKLRSLVREGADERFPQYIADIILGSSYTGPITVGDSLAVVVFDILTHEKTIEAFGFDQPKKIVSINRHPSGEILYIRFADGSRWPRNDIGATYRGKNIDVTLYAKTKSVIDDVMIQIQLSTPEDWDTLIDLNRQLPQEIDESSGYIPTKKQAHDPRWEMALTQDVRPGATGREANKLGLATDTQGHPQVANPSGKVERQRTESDNSIMEKAPASYNWKARVHIKQKGYDGYIPVQVSAPDMRRARILIAQMYGVSDSAIGSTTKVK